MGPATKVYPGHQVIEMGLVKLYRVTGDKKYLDLARFFLDVRGPKGQQYNQADLKPVDQTKAVGHAVRATYMYSGMADIAAIEEDTSYLNAIDQDMGRYRLSIKSILPEALEQPEEMKVSQNLTCFQICQPIVRHAHQ